MPELYRRGRNEEKAAAAALRLGAALDPLGEKRKEQEMITAILAVALLFCVGIIYHQHGIILKQRRKIIEALDWIDPVTMTWEADE